MKEEPFNPDEFIKKLKEEIQNNKGIYSEEDITDLKTLIEMLEKYKVMSTPTTGENPINPILIKLLIFKIARLFWKIFRIILGEGGDELDPPPE